MAMIWTWTESAVNSIDIFRHEENAEVIDGTPTAAIIRDEDLTEEDTKLAQFIVDACNTKEKDQTT